MMTMQEQPARGMRKHWVLEVKSWIIISLVLIGVCGGTGCLVVPISGGRKNFSYSPETRRTKRADIAFFYPEAGRYVDDENIVWIRLMAKGTFTDEITREKATKITAQRKVAVGILPGMASLNPGSVVGGTVLAIWYNILFLGTPTLNGLLIEPFNPNPVPDSQSVNDGHAFRRSALLGFHKYELPAKNETGYPKTTPLNPVSETRAVENITCSFRIDSPSENVFWGNVSFDNGFGALDGVPPGEHVGTLTLKNVPSDHYLRDALLPLRDFEMKVVIPAK